MSRKHSEILKEKACPHSMEVLQPPQAPLKILAIKKVRRTKRPWNLLFQGLATFDLHMNNTGCYFRSSSQLLDHFLCFEVGRIK